MRASPSRARVLLAGALVTVAVLTASASALAEDIAPPPRPRNVLIADLGLHVIAGGYQRMLAP